MDLNIDDIKSGDDESSQTKIEPSEERLKILIETAADLIFSLNNYGNFISVNNNGALILEFKPEEMTGKHFLGFVEDSDKAVIVKSFQEILKTSKVITFEVKFLSKFGKIVIFEISARSITDADKVSGVLGTGKNITQRRSYEDKMKELNSKFLEAHASGNTVQENPKSYAARTVASMHRCVIMPAITKWRIFFFCSWFKSMVSLKLFG